MAANPTRRGFDLPPPLVSRTPSGNKRKKWAAIEGSEYKLARKEVYADRDGTAVRVWVPCDIGAPDNRPDTIVHRYARDVGFLSEAKADGDEKGNNMVAASVRDLNAGVGDLVESRVLAQATFECFVLSKGQNTAYYRFLQTLMGFYDDNGLLKMTGVEKVPFDPPSSSIVETYVLFLRNTRGLQRGGIEPLLSGLSAVNGQFSGVRIARTRLKPLLDRWEREDKDNGKTKQARVFSVMEDLPYLHRGFFVAKWSDDVKVVMWTMFLSMCTVLGRSSCMTKYCPLIENIEYPNGPGGYDDQGSGFPKRLYVPWTNWKNRVYCVGEKYFLVIQQNYTDTRYCPVTWLMLHLSRMRQHGEPMSGPIFPYWTSKQFQRKLKTGFKNAAKVAQSAGNLVAAERLAACSSHSPRRTFTQLAFRCGNPETQVCDVGRWRDRNQIRFYAGQGMKERTRAVDDSGDGRDPIGGIWVFRTFVRASADGEEYMRV